VDVFRRFAESVSKSELLRIYWYDGTSAGPSPQHLSLAHLNDVKVRLGFVNTIGQQKGVDSLIVTDMIELARNRAVSDLVLLSGDEDIRVGVQQAQQWGVRVHLVGIKPSRGSQSLTLLQEADTTHEWVESDIAPFLVCVQVSAPRDATSDAIEIDAARAGVNRQSIDAALSEVAKVLANAIPESDLPAALLQLDAKSGYIPPQFHGRLLAGGRTSLGRDLDRAEKAAIGAAFKAACATRAAQAGVGGR
jgi:hypothetical protein